MPANWNGRFMFEDVGGIGGTVSNPGANATPNFGLINGYAVATEDGGHLNTELALPTCDSGYGNLREFFLDPVRSKNRKALESLGYIMRVNPVQLGPSRPTDPTQPMQPLRPAGSAGPSRPVAAVRQLDLF
jgi:hypothetical protein